MPTQIAPDDIAADRASVDSDAREPLVLVEPLVAFLDERGLGEGEPAFTAIGDGHSNVTLRVDRGAASYVLRRPPRGPLPPSAHDVLREAHVISALEGRARVPRVLARCEDPEVIGAPFYVMELIDGPVIAADVPPALDSPEDRRRIGTELVDALAELHAVDWQQAGLGDFGKPTGYLERQLRRFGGLWDHNKTRDVPEVERVGRWLADNLPQSPAATIVHGDFRLGNVIYDGGSPATLAAILDWEMATIGDPLADLGYLATLWADRDDPPSMFELGSVSRQDGFLRRDELVARYEQATGRSTADLPWYRTLAVWKSIVFMEGNYKRAVAGATDDPWLKSFGEGVLELARRAEELTQART